IDTVLIPGGDPAIATWSEGIALGQSVGATISLAGKTLPGEILVEISGNVCGSSAPGDFTIENNSDTRDSDFVVKVQAVDLKVSGATAEIPSQTIKTDGEILLGESLNKLDYAKIMQGNLGIFIDNDLPINAILHLKIPSIDKTRDTTAIDTFFMDIDIAAKTNDITEYETLNTYFLRMKIDSQKVKYEYTIETEATGDTMVQVLSTDKVMVDINLYGESAGDDITFSEFKGLVDQTIDPDNGNIDVTSDSQIKQATLSSGSIIIDITNYINTDSVGVPSIKIEIPQFLDPDNKPIEIDQDITPGLNRIPLDLTNYSLHPLTDETDPNNITQNITYSTQVIVPNNKVGEYNLLDSILVDIIIDDMSFSSVEGYFSQDAMTDSNVIELDTDIKLEVARIDTGELYIKVINKIGIIADVEFAIDEIFDTGHSPMVETLTLSAGSTIELTVPLKGYSIEMPSATPGAIQELHYVSTISIPSDSLMTLTFGQDIDVRVEMRNLSFS
ncbi:MAG: hypothetical protein KAI81_09970, partial [Candidatus Marinimicrobia bacterium]|nr:hypothetical protein [Candidatus Neomarinimicrobiota bacterium]